MSSSLKLLSELIEQNKDHSCGGFGAHKVCVRMIAAADLPTRFGPFHIIAFCNNRDAKEHVALVHGDVIRRDQVPTRLHSECLTGDALGSLRCDCRDQLEQALYKLVAFPYGVLLYLRQEGRGIGLVNKIKAYTLQDQGLDTIEANLALGFREDERDYAIAAHMLQSLHIRSIQLMTNNPKKMDEMAKHGVSVVKRLPHVILPNAYNRFYLETKAQRSGHWLDFESSKLISEQKNDDPAASIPPPDTTKTGPS